MFLLLVLLTLSVMVLPLLPALQEWLRPSDVVPLRIDEADALDPPGLARSFAALLAGALQAGATQLGGADIASVDQAVAEVGLPLSAAEITAGRSDRLWRIEGDVQLPDGTDFYVELQALADLRTAPRQVYRALWAGGIAALAPHTTVLRWAHGRVVHVATGCHLAGRVTAQQYLMLAPDVAFMLLHAPCISFEPQPATGAARAQAEPEPRPMIRDWPTGVVWTDSVRRAFARTALQLPGHTAWAGDVVCLSHLALGEHSQAGGSLKARGDLFVDQHSCVSGSLVAEGVIELAGHCTVLGAVVSETAILIGPGCTIGTLDKPATVTAPQIRMAAGTRVHGTVWATEQGLTFEPQADVAVPVPVPEQGVSA